MVRMCERRAWDEHEVSIPDRDHRIPDVVVVAVSFVVEASERKPRGRHAEDLGCLLILVTASPSRLAFGLEVGSAIPTACGRGRLGVASEHGDELDPVARARPPRHGRTDREHAVVEVWRDDHQPERVLAMLRVGRHPSTMIAALTAGEQHDQPSGWRRFVPASIRRRLRPIRKAVVDWRRRRPPRLGALRRVTPIDPNWGFERGTPIDRIYVDQFMHSRAEDIRGRVLEIAAPDYTTRFGTNVEQVDILMASEGNPRATIVGDLANAPHVADDTFDCAIVTQTLQFVYEVRAAFRTLHRILAPGGVLLATVPGITKISPPEDDEWGEWWHYTGRSARRLAEEAFGQGNVDVRTYGNVLAAAGFLYGLAASDLRPEELASNDRLYEVTIAIRAVKAPVRTHS